MFVLKCFAIQVTYQVNLGVQIALGNFRPGTDTVFVSGTFSSPNWISTPSASAYVLSPSAGDSNIYTGTFNIINPTGTTEDHKFVINPNNSYNSSTLNWESVTGGGNRSFLVGSGNMLLPVVYFSDLSSLPPPSPPSFPFIAGADFSLLSFFEGHGVLYKDGGQAQDGLQILKNHGINCVRLRLFTSSAAQASSDPYDYINSLTYTVPLAVRVKNAGLLFSLDFHYSDTWADPGHQATPAAWTNLNFTQLVQQMRTYNSNSIATFAAAGAMPDFVQIGNEITSGMLWPSGQVSGNGGTPWMQLGQLMKAAVQGIQDASGTNMPKIIVHIDRGGDWASTMWFFDNLNAQGVSFDIIGESYYPFFQGSPSSLSNCLNSAAIRYGKPLVVAEDAFPWTNSCPASWTNSLFGFPPTVTGQVNFIAAVARIVEKVPNHLGAGFFYWGTEYQAANGITSKEAGYNTASFFDAGGNVLPVADAVGGMAAPLKLSVSLDGSILHLVWPFSGAGSSLMTAARLSSPASWVPVTNRVQTTGTLFNVALPLDTTLSRFYRLQAN